MAVRQTVEKAVIRDEQNRRIQSAATNPVKEVLKILHTTLIHLYLEVFLKPHTQPSRIQILSLFRYHNSKNDFLFEILFPSFCNSRLLLLS